MHIVHIANKPIPATGGGGGMPHSVTWLATCQARFGHQVSIISPEGYSTSAFNHIRIAPEMTENQLKAALPAGADVVHTHYAVPRVELALDDLGLAFVTHIRGNHIGKPSTLRNRLYVSRHHAALHGHAHFVYNGLPVQDYPFQGDKGDALLFLGKVKRSNKGVDLAIKVARQSRELLVIAGGKRLASVETWLPVNRRIRSVGVVAGQQKLALLAGAKGFLFPIRWPEPFGLVLLEAMACGTPVIAMNRGAVPEIVEHGRTGYVCESVEEMVGAVNRIGEIDPSACRRAVEERFSIDKTYHGCMRYYERAIAGEVW